MRSSPPSQSELHTQLLAALDAEDWEKSWDKTKAISRKIDAEVVALTAVSKPRDATQLLESVIDALSPKQLDSVERYAKESEATECLAFIAAYRARQVAETALRAAGM